MSVGSMLSSSPLALAGCVLISLSTPSADDQPWRLSGRKRQARADAQAESRRCLFGAPTSYGCRRRSVTTDPLIACRPRQCRNPDRRPVGSHKSCNRNSRTRRRSRNPRASRRKSRTRFGSPVLTSFRPQGSIPKCRNARRKFRRTPVIKMRRHWLGAVVTLAGIAAAPIGASTVSTGKPGRSTPTGIFTALQKQVVHHSSKYGQ